MAMLLSRGLSLSKRGVPCTSLQEGRKNTKPRAIVSGIHLFCITTRKVNWKRDEVRHLPLWRAQSPAGHSISVRLKEVKLKSVNLFLRQGFGMDAADAIWVLSIY